MSTTRITAAPEQTGDTHEAEAARPARQEEPAAAALLAAAGNQAMSRRGVVSDDAVTAMRADADRIVEKLKEQVLDAEEEQEVLNWVQAWADWDTSYARGGGTGTPYLDRFLQVLKGRTFSRSTGRKLFGLAGDEWLNAYDALFHEMEDERLDRFKAIVARSGKEGTPGPTERQMDSVYSVVGKHVGLGAWGILKQTSVAVTGLADAVIWLDWRARGLPGDPPQITPAVAEQYNEAAKLMAEAAATGDASTQELLESFGTGDRQGKVVGILMLAGTGTAGQAIKGAAMVGQVAQGVQGAAAAADAINVRIGKMRAANPKATWSDFIADDEVQLQLMGGLAALVGVVGALAGDSGALAEFFKRCGLLVDVVAFLPLLKKTYMHYTSAELALQPELRAHTLEEDVADIVGNLAAIIGGKYDAARAQAREGGGSSEGGGGQPSGEGGGGGGTGGGGGEGPGGGAELGRPELLEPHPADPQTGLIKEGPEFIPEKGVEVDPAVRDQLLEGKGSFIGEPEPTTVPLAPEPVPEPLPRTAYMDENGVVRYTEPRQPPVVEKVERPQGVRPEGTVPVEEGPAPRREEPPEHPFDPELQERQEEGADWTDEPAEPDPAGKVRNWPENPLDLPEYQEAVEAAQRAMTELPAAPGVKTTAGTEGGEPTLSGYKPTDDYPNSGVATERAQQAGREAGREPEPHPHDRSAQAGDSGQVNGSHAEKQAAALSPDAPVGVSKPMCGDCQGHFRQLAIEREFPQVVADPEMTRIFMPDGRVIEVPHPEGILGPRESPEE